MRSRNKSNCKARRFTRSFRSRLMFRDQIAAPMIEPVHVSVADTSVSDMNNKGATTMATKGKTTTKKAEAKKATKTTTNKTEGFRSGSLLAPLHTLLSDGEPHT